MHRPPIVLFSVLAALALANAPDVRAQSSYIPVQGRLTTAAGVPLEGPHTLAFRLYGVASGGTPLCEDAHAVNFDHGLFSNYFSGSGCSIDGRQLYFALEVDGDGEMTPRLFVDNSVYAWGLRPGSLLKDTLASNALFHLENDAPNGRALRAYATATTGTNYGVVGASTSPSGYGGYFYNNADGVGLWAQSMGTGGGDAISADSESGDGVSGSSAGAGGRGIYGNNSGGGTAIAARANSAGTLYPALYVVQENASGNFVIGASTYLGTRLFRIDRTGKGFFNGGTQVGGADFAERLDVAAGAGELEAGDVLVVSATADRAVERSSAPFATTVMGVYSTRPGVLAGAPDLDTSLAGVPVAITGIVPCKVTAEGGSIRRGDLLVTSSTPGHAMRAGTAPPPGSVLGKALQPLDAERGVIEILVNAR